MTKVIYARVAEDTHAYLTGMAAESGLSMSRVVEALVRGARDQGWRVRPVTAGPDCDLKLTPVTDSYSEFSSLADD